MCDPVFGLKLWLQKPFGDELFWAYHYEHLQLLEHYVRAKLRERGIDNKGSKNSLMFSRLPTFITKAGNREEVLKIINALQIKVLCIKYFFKPFVNGNLLRLRLHLC